MRTFIALETGPEVQKTLTGIVGTLKEKYPKARWSRPGTMHLTLRFLGEVTASQIGGVAEAVHAAAHGVAPFTLNLGEPGHFGRNAPRVMFMTVEGKLKPLQMLYDLLGERLAACGFPPEERSFTPHITLGRSKRAKMPASWSDFPVTGIRDFSVEEVVVFQSELTRSGPLYTPLARCPLRPDQ